MAFYLPPKYSTLLLMKARGRAKIVDGVCYDAHVFEEVFTTGLLYSTILHSSLLHRQLAPTLTATYQWSPGMCGKSRALGTPGTTGGGLCLW